MPHSVKFSWFLSEFIVLKVEIEDRNLVSALLRKIPGSDGKNIDFASTIHQNAWFQVCIFKNFWGGLTQRLHRLLSPLNLWLCLRFGFSPSILRRLRHRSVESVWVSPSIHPSNMFINPSSNRRGLDQTLFPNPNFLSSPTLDPKSCSKST